MLVSNNSALQALASLYANDAAKNVRRTQKTETVSFKEEFSMSEEAQSFSEMLDKLQSMGDTRADKVAAFEQQLAGGAYNVSAENVAASMIGL